MSLASPSDPASVPASLPASPPAPEQAVRPSEAAPTPAALMNSLLESILRIILNRAPLSSFGGHKAPRAGDLARATCKVPTLALPRSGSVGHRCPSQPASPQAPVSGAIVAHRRHTGSGSHDIMSWDPTYPQRRRPLNGGDLRATRKRRRGREWALVIEALRLAGHEPGAVCRGRSHRGSGTPRAPQLRGSPSPRPFIRRAICPPRS